MIVAALLLQGSIQVYSRKVEYLYTLVLRALEFLSQKRFDFTLKYWPLRYSWYLVFSFSFTEIDSRKKDNSLREATLALVLVFPRVTVFVLIYDV